MPDLPLILIELLFGDSHLSPIRYSSEDQLSARVIAGGGATNGSSVAQILNAAWLRRSDVEASKGLSRASVIERTEAIGKWAEEAATVVLG